MPVCFLLCLSVLYSAMLSGKNMYGSKIIPLPAPQFIVFYNGKDERSDRDTINLSDAYPVKEGKVSLELKVDVLNINAGHNKELLETCRTLGDYAEYVRRIRLYVKDMTIHDAVERTITECIHEGILKDFLEENRAEAKAMSIFEYNEEEHIRMEREVAFEDGREQERMNTERERQRAEMAEAEIERLKLELEKIKKI